MPVNLAGRSHFPPSLSRPPKPSVFFRLTRRITTSAVFFASPKAAAGNSRSTALPPRTFPLTPKSRRFFEVGGRLGWANFKESRSEEHTSELQSRGHLVCRLLLEKK